MITKEETAQIVSMMNWAEKHEYITVFKMSYADCNKKEGEKPSTSYNIDCSIWYKNKWKSCTGRGDTLTEAMTEFSKMWQERKYDDL